MRLPWTAPTIRARLTGWYAVALTAMMVVYATATFVAVRHEFLEQLDERLHDDFEVAEGRLTREADGTIRWAAAHQEAHDGEARVYEVWAPTGEQIHRSGAQPPLPPLALAQTGTSYRYETIIANGERWRTI